jgi:PAS domain S-box-containing protein
MIKNLQTGNTSAVHSYHENNGLFITIADSANAGIYLTDTEGNFTYANHCWIEMTGLSGQNIHGNNWIAALHPEDRTTVILEWNTMLKTGKKVEHIFRIQTPDGRTTKVAARTAPQYDEYGKIVRFIGIAIPLSVYNNSIEQLVAFQTFESLGVVLGSIAHEFNNLMGGIFGYIDIALGEIKNTQIAGYLLKASETLERTRELTSVLLALSKGSNPVLSPDALFPFIQTAIQSEILSTSVSASFDIPDQLWQCNFDKTQIAQVVVNLIRNSRHAMPEGGAIGISAVNLSAEESANKKNGFALKKIPHVRVSIKDTGTGIADDLLPKISNPFFAAKSDGRGLGLITCFSIMKRHGGAIDIESEKGKGTTVHLFFPAISTQIPLEPIPSSANTENKGRILIMDDEEVIRGAVGGMLKVLGYAVECKMNGLETIEFFKEETIAGRPFSALILDLTIYGGMGGKDTVAQIRKINPNIPIIVASGYTTDPVMENPKEYGFTAAIQKPFRKTTLTETLENIFK